MVCGFGAGGAGQCLLEAELYDSDGVYVHRQWVFARTCESLSVVSGVCILSSWVVSWGIVVVWVFSRCQAIGVSGLFFGFFSLLRMHLEVWVGQTLEQ